MHYRQGVMTHQLMGKYFVKDSKKTVYDIGSYSVNGSNKQDVLNLGLNYIGVDIATGPNVDIVVDQYKWDPLPEGGCEYVISGSCLEHVEAPWLWAKELERCLKPGGICIVVTPFTREEHKYPVDCYRYLPDGVKFLFTKWAKLECLECGFSDKDIKHPNGKPYDGNDPHTDIAFIGRKPL